MAGLLFNIKGESSFWFMFSEQFMILVLKMKSSYAPVRHDWGMEGIYGFRPVHLSVFMYIYSQTVTLPIIFYPNK